MGVRDQLLGIGRPRMPSRKGYEVSAISPGSVRTHVQALLIDRSTVGLVTNGRGVLFNSLVLLPRGWPGSLIAQLS